MQSLRVEVREARAASSTRGDDESTVAGVKRWWPTLVTESLGPFADFVGSIEAPTNVLEPALGAPRKSRQGWDAQTELHLNLLNFALVRRRVGFGY